MNNAAGMIRKNYLIHLTMALLCALVTFVGNEYLGFALGAVIYATFMILQYGDGCDRGERACTLTATMEKMLSEGREPDQKLRSQTFDKANAVKAFLYSSLPLALLAGVNVLLADTSGVGENTLGMITRLAFFPAAWLTRLMTALVGVDYAGALDASNAVFGNLSRAGFDFPSLLNQLAGIETYAYAYDFHYLTWLRVMYIPISFISPLFMMLGYLQGPKMRLKKLEEIKKGTRRKRKKLKVFGKPKQPKQMKPQV